MGLCDMLTAFTREHSCTALTLSAVGAAVVAGLGYSIIQFLLQTFILSGRSLSKYGAKNGAWAGATDGIGREFASQLAKAGFNVFIASRSQDKLDAFASELKSKYSVNAKTYAIDFSRRDVAAYTGLAEALEGLDIGVL
ncbi:hypothetical protein FRC07_009816, partial [Ceratobasidium sp. 392]